MPLGLEDRRVPNGHLTASTYYNSALSPWHGRLNGIYSWSVRRNRVGEWFQVNFVELMRIKGVATQGRQNANQWVRRYMVSYSVDEMNFRSYRQGRSVKVKLVISLVVYPVREIPVLIYMLNYFITGGILNWCCWFFFRFLMEIPTAILSCITSLPSLSRP